MKLCIFFLINSSIFFILPYYPNAWYLLPVANWANRKTKKVNKLTFIIPFHIFIVTEFSNKKSRFLLKMRSIFCSFCPLSFLSFVIFLLFLLTCLFHLSFPLFPLKYHHFFFTFFSCLPTHPPSRNYASVFNLSVIHQIQKSSCIWTHSKLEKYTVKQDKEMLLSLKC